MNLKKISFGSLSLLSFVTCWIFFYFFEAKILAQSRHISDWGSISLGLSLLGVALAIAGFAKSIAIRKFLLLPALGLFFNVLSACLIVIAISFSGEMH